MQGVESSMQPTDMLRLHHELAAAHKLVAHLKIELEAANGKIDILRWADRLLIHTLIAAESSCTCMSTGDISSGSCYKAYVKDILTQQAWRACNATVDIARLDIV